MKHKEILTVDIGNSCTKVTLYGGETPLDRGVIGYEACDTTWLRSLLGRESVAGVALCRVGDDPCRLADLIRQSGVSMLELSSSTPLPIAIDYVSKETLGADRIAAAVGVMDDSASYLVVDAGTAVTVDLVADCHFIGGNISPGLALRFRSLHNYTSRLPLVEAEGEIRDFGVDTDMAIRSGVVNGLAAEIADSYHAAISRYDNTQLILTGGDAPFLSELLQRRSIPHRIDQNAVGRGLVRIYNHNYSL